MGTNLATIYPDQQVLRNLVYFGHVFILNITN